MDPLIVKAEPEKTTVVVIDPSVPVLVIPPTVAANWNHVKEGIREVQKTLKEVKDFLEIEEHSK